MTDVTINQGWDQNDGPLSTPGVPRTKQLQDLVNILATNYQLVDSEERRQRSKPAGIGRDLAGHDLELYETWLAEAHRFYREASQQKLPLTYDSEWILDNYYIIRQALQQIKEDLPPSFFNQLPRLVGEPLKGYPRIYAIARTVLVNQHLLLDPVDLQFIMIQFQGRVLITMGELWALPIFLRYSLIEALAHQLVTSIQPLVKPDLPPLVQGLPGEEALLGSTEAAAGATTFTDGVANIILSLRTISEQDWSDFFEAVSRLERTLRKDPAGIYPRMDFKTRDMYCKEIEKLSLGSGRGEHELAEILLDLANPNGMNNANSTQAEADDDPQDDPVSLL